MTRLLQRIVSWLLERFGTGKTHRAPRVGVIHLAGHRASEYAREQLAAVVHPSAFQAISCWEHVPGIDENSVFFCAGHGDPSGPFASADGRSGNAVYGCEPSELESWHCRPLIWWVCFSAVWLAKSNRRDWLGFRGLIGYDLRSRDEARWWKAQLRRLMKVALNTAAGLATPDDFVDQAQRMYDEARRGCFARRTRSYATVLCARAIAGGVDWGAEFGV